MHVLAERLLAPLREAEVDTLLLGCTHYPFLARTISDVMGRDVVLVSSADETAFEMRAVLEGTGLRRRGAATGRTTSGSPRATPHASAARSAACSGPSSTGSKPGTRLADRTAHRTGFRRGRPRRATPSGRTMTGLRADGREPDDLRTVELVRDYTEFAAGSVLIRMGKTVVLCTASVADEVPRWMRNSGRGWVTAEYSMLPGSSPERIDREAARGRQSGRTQEIQRLIGRSLRAVTDLGAMPRGADHPRLRRPAGGRGDPDRQHLRGLRRPARRLHPAGPRRPDRRPPPAARPAPPSRSASSTALPCSIWLTPRTVGPRWT